MSVIWEKIAYDGKHIRLTEAQKRHVSFFHPEALANEDMLMETLAMPDLVTRGGQQSVHVLYRHYDLTPVSSKYLAVVVKILNEEALLSPATSQIR